MTLRAGAAPPLVSQELLRDALKAYDLPEGPELRFLRRGFNDHYEVSFPPDGQPTASSRFILRVYLVDKPYMGSLDEIDAELQALVSLARQGIPVSAPLPRRDGASWGLLDTEGQARPLALFTWAAGEERSGDDLGETAAANLGRALARLHAAADAHGLGARRYTLDETFLVDRPVAAIQAVLGQDAADLEPYGELLKAELRQVPRTPGQFGFIHGDLHSGNFHIHGDRCTLFDFDHSAQGWRAYDLVALYLGLPDRSWAALLQAYRSVRPFSPDEEAALPLFARARRLWDLGDFLAMRATGAWGIDPLSEKGRAQVQAQVRAMLAPAPA